MTRRFTRGVLVALGLGACLVPLACARPLLPSRDATEVAGRQASTRHAVPLEDRAWSSSAAVFRGPSASSPFVRTGLRPPDLDGDPAWIRTADTAGRAPTRGRRESRSGRVLRPEAHAPDAHSNHFRFTTVRLWLYRDFVPDGSDPDILGVEVNSAWGWGHVDVTNISYFELADYPRPVPGMPAGNPEPGSEPATGITDLMSATLFSKQRAHHGPHHVALGFAFQLPTASHDILGGGKWSIGPAVEYEYTCGRFFAGFIALQLWSVAGDADRKDVNMLMVKPMITYELSRRWKAVYMPYGISVYWDKPIEDAVYLPLGGGLQYEFRIGSQKMAASAQLFQYVLRSSKGSEHDLRFMLEFDF